MLQGDDCIIIIHFKRYSCATLFSHNLVKIRGGGGRLATAIDLAAFRLPMIAPVKKSVNHSRTAASMRETGWEQEVFTTV